MSEPRVSEERLGKMRPALEFIEPDTARQDMRDVIDDLRETRAALAGLQADCAALHQGYRGYMIARTARVGPAGAAEGARVGAWSCECTCNREEWMDGEPERHKDDCMARPDLLPGAGEALLREMEALRKERDGLIETLRDAMVSAPKEELLPGGVYHVPIHSGPLGRMRAALSARAAAQ